MDFAGTHVNSERGRNSPKKNELALSFHWDNLSMRNGLTGSYSASIPHCSEQEQVLGRQTPAQQQSLRAQHGVTLVKAPRSSCPHGISAGPVTLMGQSSTAG